ncbi:MAG: hypothetical protein ABIG69_03035 [Bacteroidota bacterium]
MLSKKINNGLLLFVSVLFLIGCEEEKKDFKFAARVNDKYLTLGELDKYTEEDVYKSKFKSEYVRQWIEKELLFQIAADEHLTESEEFMQLVDFSNRELATALYLKSYYKNNPVNVVYNEILDYYNKRRSEFKLSENAYFLNIVHFKNKEVARLFRLKAMADMWNNSLSDPAFKELISNNAEGIFLYEHQIQPMLLLRSVRNLHEKEISITLNTEPQIYTVVQLLKKIDSGSIAEINYVKNEIEDRIIAFKRKEMYKNLIDDLYSKYDVEINRDFN